MCRGFSLRMLFRLRPCIHVHVVQFQFGWIEEREGQKCIISYICMCIWTKNLFGTMKGPLRPRLGPSHLPRCHILVARINHVIGFCKGQTWVSNIISIGIGNPSRKETKTFRSIFLRTQEHSRQSFLESSVLFLVLYIHRMD